MTDATSRFSSRVENYVKYRPRYPVQVLTTMQQECGLKAESIIADIGSGTGALTELFLRNGNQVFAVEPNGEMRTAAEGLLEHLPGFHSISGRAEATNLDSGALDYVVTGQAFHWFDVLRSREEFSRILKPGGWAMVVWNEREFETTAFLIAYNRLLIRFAPDYAREKHKQVYDTALSRFFGAQGYESRTFGYRQEMDFAGVKGRMLSSSYTPEAGHPNHEPMMAELAEIFRIHAVNDSVAFEYTTRMYYGRL
jgi:SAM-dependent methyltransferase